MTAQQFTHWAEQVYGKYTPAMKAEVEKYLSADSQYYNARWIDALRDVTLREHPYTFRTPPGVHEIHAMRLMVHPLSHELLEADARKELPA